MHGFDFIQDLAVVMLIAGVVGWVCHRVGLSVVTGYLAAGIVLGPYTPPFSLVTSAARIETLSQLGLVFLMFSIGMKLSLRRLKRLGLSLVVATVVGAVIMYNLARAVGAGLGWGSVHTVFLAAMLMVSSSAIVSRMLQETGTSHEKTGQMAMGVSVLEDIVAVVMLTILSSITHSGGFGGTSVGMTLALLGAFVAVAGIGGLLAVPWLLRKLSVTADQELITIVTAGLLFMLAVLAQKAGFTLALGAFLLGAIVAETPHRQPVDRIFEGMRDLFSAVFFVAIGMMIDPRSAAHLWWLVLLIGALALVGRTLAVGTGILVTGAPVHEAVRTGLTVTPLGEFSFIIAQMGIAAGLPSGFQAMAVGASLLTTLAAPVLVRHAGGIGDRVEAWLPRWLTTWLENYHQWIARLTERGRRSKVWQLSRKRLIQIAVEMLLVTGLMVFSESIFNAVSVFLPGEKLFGLAPRMFFWGGLTLIVLVPLVALWRNVSAMAMMYAEMSTVGNRDAARLRPVVETGIKTVAGVLLFIWLNTVAPLEGMGRWMPVLVLALAVAAVVLLRSRLIYWHSVLEVALQERLVESEQRLGATAAPWLASHGEWHLALTECLLPDLADCRGRTLGELGLRAKFGCVVAGIERQGLMLGNPPPDTALYPRDKVLLLGDPKQTEAAKTHLLTVSGTAQASHFDEVRMEIVTLPHASKLLGQTLAELAPSRRHGVQIAGINRDGSRLLNPGADEKLLAGDEVLVLGGPEQIAAFRAWVEE
jgi:CPA2 family monovalent cation:H+ antiporter-2